MNYFRLFPLQTHYKLTVLKIFLILIKKSTYFTAHIREQSIVKVPRDKIRDMLPNCSCQITKM